MKYAKKPSRLENMKKVELVKYAKGLRHQKASALKELEKVKEERDAAYAENKRQKLETDKMRIALLEEQEPADTSASAFDTASRKELEEMTKDALIGEVVSGRRKVGYLKNRCEAHRENFRALQQEHSRCPCVGGGEDEPQSDVDNVVAPYLTLKKSLTRMTKAELAFEVRELARKLAIVQNTQDNDRRLFQEEMTKNTKLKDELARYKSDFEAVVRKHAECVQENAVTEDQQKRRIDELLTVIEPLQNSYNRLKALHGENNEALDELRCTLFHPTLMLSLHHFLEQERFAGKKEKVEQLLARLGEHMVKAAAQDPDIWKRLVEELY